MGSASAILTAVITFIVGQLIMKFSIDPILEYKKAVAAIDRHLTMYQSECLSDPEKLEELRLASAILNSSYRAIPLIWLHRMIFFLPKTGDIDKARFFIRAIYSRNKNRVSETELSVLDCIVSARKALGLRV